MTRQYRVTTRRRFVWMTSRLWRAFGTARIWRKKPTRSVRTEAAGPQLERMETAVATITLSCAEMLEKSIERIEEAPMAEFL